MEYLLSDISPRHQTSKMMNLNEIESPIITRLLRASGKGIQTELLGNVIIPFFVVRSLYLIKIKEYQKYYEIWNCLKLPNTYQKIEKQLGTVLQSKQLKSLTIKQGLTAIDNNWNNSNLWHICIIKEEEDYVLS